MRFVLSIVVADLGTCSLNRLVLVSFANVVSPECMHAGLSGLSIWNQCWACAGNLHGGVFTDSPNMTFVMSGALMARIKAL